MVFLSFISGLLVLILLAIFVRLGIYIYTILTYKGDRSRAVTAKTSRANSATTACEVRLTNNTNDESVINIESGRQAAGTTTTSHPVDVYHDPSVVSQVVLRDGQLVVLNYSMTDEYTLVRKFCRQPSAPPLELDDDDAPPPYDECVRK